MEVLMDYIDQLDWVAVIAAAVAGFGVGAMWYSQSLFGKQWMKAAGINGKKIRSDKMSVIMVLAALMVFITSVALAILVDVLVISGFGAGAVLGALVATGFIVTNSGMHKLYEQRPASHFGITAAGDVVTLAVMGGVLGLLA